MPSIYEYLEIYAPMTNLIINYPGRKKNLVLHHEFTYDFSYHQMQY
jgi:hypothetical protein